MRVIIELDCESVPLRRFVLQDGQEIRFGRTEWADVAVPDPQMSAVHVSLGVCGKKCLLKDLGSTNGTFVNGRKVAETVLHHGDRIRAGGSAFTVQIPEQKAEGADTVEMPEGEVSQTIVSLDSKAAGPPRIAGRIEFRTRRCASGVLAVVGTGEAPEAGAVARALAKRYPLYLVANFHRLRRTLPEKPADFDFLIDWVPAETRTRCSPVILSDSKAALTLIDECWSQDAMLAVFSLAERATLLGHLRALAGAFARPSVLASQLVDSAPVHAQNVLSDVEGVLLEDPAPARWTILALPESVMFASLGELGFCEQQAFVGGKGATAAPPAG